MNDAAAKQKLLLPLLCGLFLSVAVLSSVVGEMPRGTPRGLAAVAPAVSEPALSAEAYIVRFAGDTTPLLGRRIDKPTAPASLTKLMTAAVAAEKLSAADTGVLSAYAKEVEERRSPAKTGEEFSRDDLLRLSLVMSANDAALALAERVGEYASAFSSPERAAAFVRLMNAKARILGMEETHFENPTGLDAPGHLSTANDLARLAEYILRRHPRLWEMTRAEEVPVTALNHAVYTIATSNDLLREFPALIGGKTGLTDHAKEALLLLYPVAPNRTAIIVILRSEDRFGDGRKIIHWLEENF
ncbi:MAG: hypothetical protein AAB533_04375 [Patescibacteria group bacterium]